MILDELAQAGHYRGLSERFDFAFEFLVAKRFEALGEGRHEVRGSDVLAIVQTYPTKPASEGRWEGHRTYADIQFIVSGRERMGFAALRNMREIEAYDAGRDLAFFSGTGQFLDVGAGELAVF